jgi:hypothetical protein
MYTCAKDPAGALQLGGSLMLTLIVAMPLDTIKDPEPPQPHASTVTVIAATPAIQTDSWRL